MSLPFFSHFQKNTISIYSGRNLVLQLIAFFLTYIIVITGFDWKYYSFIRSTSLPTYFHPAIFIGMILPIFGFPFFYLLARSLKRTDLLLQVWALAQAGFLGWCISALYKAFTGRVQPPKSLAIDTSHNWNFGFYEHGIFWGWPSSHTMVAFSMAFALIAMHPKRKTVLTFSLIYALYIGIGVSTQIHWFSEFVAGAIIGAVVGTVVGKSFLKEKKK
jgi:membrane-associated phospholipid phosphatase